MTFISDSEFQQAMQQIEAAKSILVTTHVRPDGDALGSATALRAGLEQLGKKVEVLVLSSVPGQYAFLMEDGYTQAERDVAVEQLGTYAAEYDVVMVVDTCAVKQLPGIGEALEKRRESVIVIDHHVARDTIADCMISHTEAAAAGQLVLDFLRRMNADITQTISEALFTAIATDTGWFRFENVKASCFADAEQLTAAGARPDKLYELLYQQFPAARTKLVAKALGSLRLNADETVAMMTISKAMLTETGAKRSHVENIVNECQNIATVQAWALLVEQEDVNETRCSLRSRGGGIDVNAVARSLGGGGHARAAGVTLAMPLAEAEVTIMQALEKARGQQAVFPTPRG